jgi:hypothetical protein
VFIGVGLGLFLVRIYGDAGTGNYITLKHFLMQFAEWRDWLPHISMCTTSTLCMRERVTEGMGI